MPDPMLDLIEKVDDYATVVLTAVDGTGRPASVRVRPRPSGDGAIVALPGWGDWVEGRAGISGHSHDDRLWQQQSFVARGRLVRCGEDWKFVPDRVTPGMGYGRFGLIRMMLAGRRRAGRYLAARRIPRPAVPWDEVKAIKREALRSRV